MRLRLSLKTPVVIPTIFQKDTKEARERGRKYLEHTLTQTHPDLMRLVHEGWDIELFPNAICLEAWGLTARLKRFHDILWLEELPEKPRSPTTAAEA